MAGRRAWWWAGVLVAGVGVACTGDDKDSAASGAADTDSGAGTTDTSADDTDEPDIPDGTLDEVLPIVQEHCVVCHGGASPAAGLDLDTDFCGTVVDGRLVVPGSTGESLLYRRITSDTSPMPPAGRLDTDIIRPIGAWILNQAPCD